MNGDTIPKEMLLAQFLQYLPESERDIAKSSLNQYNEVDEEDLMEFLGDHGVRTTPSKENIGRILEEMAHKELIQCPTYVADCWL